MFGRNKSTLRKTIAAELGRLYEGEISLMVDRTERGLYYGIWKVGEDIFEAWADRSSQGNGMRVELFRYRYCF